MPASFHLPAPLPPTHMHLPNSNCETLRAAAGAWPPDDLGLCRSGPLCILKGIGERADVLWQGRWGHVECLSLPGSLASQWRCLRSQQDGRRVVGKWNGSPEPQEETDPVTHTGLKALRREDRLLPQPRPWPPDSGLCTGLQQVFARRA